MNKKKFTSMSKLLGFIIIVIVVIVICYSMYEMHRSQDLSSLPTLIGGVLAMLGSYIGFYINMAKAEHIEDKKNQITKELELIKNGTIANKEEQLIHNLEELKSNLDELDSEEIE